MIIIIITCMISVQQTLLTIKLLNIQQSVLVEVNINNRLLLIEQ